MIEMLGVLAVIGVLSLGGIQLVAGALQNQRYTQVISDTAQLVTEGRRLVCQYRDDEGYHNTAYGVFLYKSGKYPSNLTFDKTKKTYQGDLDITYNITTIDNTGAFKIAISNIPQELCIRMVIDSWGNTFSTGLSNIKVYPSNSSNSLCL